MKSNAKFTREFNGDLKHGYTEVKIGFELKISSRDRRNKISVKLRYFI